MLTISHCFVLLLLIGGVNGTSSNSLTIEVDDVYLKRRAGINLPFVLGQQIKLDSWSKLELGLIEGFVLAFRARHVTTVLLSLCSLLH